MWSEMISKCLMAFKVMGKNLNVIFLHLNLVVPKLSMSLIYTVYIYIYNICIFRVYIYI